MKAFPKKNNLVAGCLFILSAICFAGAAYFAAVSPRRGLMVLFIVLAMAQAGMGVFLLKQARKSA
jgi:hypothetical protein